MEVPKTTIFEGSWAQTASHAKGHERENYEKITGFAPKQRFTAYRGYIHNRNGNIVRPSLAHQIAGSMPKVARMLVEQQNITKDTYTFITGDSSKLKKATSLVIGSTVSGVVDAVYNAVCAISSVVRAAIDISLGMVYEAVMKGAGLVMGEDWGNFSDRLTLVKANASSAVKHINEVVRNAIRAVPVVGHFLGEGFDKVELAVIDGVERVAHYAGKAAKAVLPARLTGVKK